MRVSVLFDRLLVFLLLVGQAIGVQDKHADGSTPTDPDLAGRSTPMKDPRPLDPATQAVVGRGTGTIHPQGSLQAVPQTSRPSLLTGPHPRLAAPLDHMSRGSERGRDGHLRRRCRTSADSAAIGRAKTSNASRRLNIMGFHL